MNNNVELKKCPFCGGSAELRHRYFGQGYDSHYAKVICMNCGASGAEYFIWNEEDINKSICS